MTTARIILVRHGETAWNLEGKQQGHLDSPLTPRGLAQGGALARRLKLEDFAALYSSDLGRAYQTARFIADKTGHKILTSQRLRERNLGIFQGLTKAEIQKQFPEEYRFYKRAGPEYVIPSGESGRDYFNSTTRFLEGLAKEHSGQQIVIVTHGGVLNAAFRHALAIPLETPRRFALLNASLNVFDYEGGKWRLEVWGDVNHLLEIGTADDS